MNKRDDLPAPTKPFDARCDDWVLRAKDRAEQWMIAGCVGFAFGVVLALWKTGNLY